MAHGVDDVLSVILLARWGDLGRAATAVPLDIAPYFETVDDLADSAAQMRKLFENPIYRQHLRHRNNQQTIMVSYSDSNRDTGLASARWSVQKAQAELVRVLDDCGIALILFHGRGGTISRGGGKTHAAVLGSPAGAVRGRLRATEQGELVNAKYGLRGIALRTLEQAVGSVALATALPARKQADESSDWPQIMETIANASRDQYQALVYDSPSFSDYFRKATPVDIIERMRFTDIAGGDVSDLKTVPWDFAWTQSRHMLPGWYGFGTGLAAALDEFGMPKIREALNHWYFFRALITDVETVLARSDLSIASRYSRLAGDLHEEFFPLMEKEFALAEESIIGIRDQKTLLEGNNTLRRSIRLRNPYVDPMSLLQVELLRRWRSGGAGDPILYEALVASVNGIARGLQDSG